MRKAVSVSASALLFLLLFSAACADIALIPSSRQVNVSRNDVIGLQFQVKNLGPGETCIDLETEQDNAYIETSLSKEHFCLAENNARTVTLTIRTENAPRGLHTVLLLAWADDGNATATVSLYVAEEPEIELVAYRSDVCSGKEERISVLVRNNSDEFKEVRLQAENEMLLPYFKPSELSLSPYQEKYAWLYIYASPYSTIGSRDISMYAITEDEIAKETVRLDVVDCEEPGEEPAFTVSLDKGCYIVRKGRTEEIPFRVRNRLDSDLEVYFSVAGGLSPRLEKRSALLDEDEQRTFYITVTVPAEAVSKDYNISLKVGGNGYSVEKRTCVTPKKTHYSRLEILNNDLRIEQGESAEFIALIRNLGDYNENFEVEVENPYSKIDANVSYPEFRLIAGNSRELYISVSVAHDANIGDYQLGLEVDVNNSKQGKTLRFEVVEETAAPEPSSNTLEILSYPSSIKIDENSSTAITVTLKNSSQQEIEDVVVKLSALPAGIDSTYRSNLSLLPGEERGIELLVSTAFGSGGSYSAKVVAFNQAVFLEANVDIIVAVTEHVEGQVQGIPTGLFAAADLGNTLAWGLALAAILLIAAAVLRYASGSKQKLETGLAELAKEVQQLPGKKLEEIGKTSEKREP